MNLSLNYILSIHLFIQLKYVLESHVVEFQVSEVNLSTFIYRTAS